jgi:hypothetical protein
VSTILVRKLEEREPQGHLDMCEDNTDMEIREIGRVLLDWIILTQDRDHRELL